MADTAYDADHFRQAIADKGAIAVIPNNPSRRPNIRSTSTSTPSAISSSVASPSSSSSAGSPPASKRPPGTTSPSSLRTFRMRGSAAPRVAAAPLARWIFDVLGGLRHLQTGQKLHIAGQAAQGGHIGAAAAVGGREIPPLLHQCVASALLFLHAVLQVLVGVAAAACAVAALPRIERRHAVSDGDQQRSSHERCERNHGAPSFHQPAQA